MISLCAAPNMPRHLATRDQGYEQCEQKRGALFVPLLPLHAAGFSVMLTTLLDRHKGRFDLL